MTYQLREHQTESVQALRKSFASGHKRPVLQAPTGMGKTLIAVDIIKSALEKDKRVWFVVDRVQLIDQTSNVFDKHGIAHGIIQANHWRYDPRIAVQLISVQTLIRKKTLNFDVDLIIVDECHATFKAFNNLLEKINAVPVIGLTATPWAVGMGKIYDDLVVIKDTQALIDGGYLCDYIAYGSTDIDLKGIKTLAGEYNQKQVAERVNTKKIVGNVVDTWLKRGENRQTVCFSVNVAHSKAIVDEFVANGVTAEHIDAHTSPEDRADAMERHDSGEVKILSNVGITTKGWDSPNTTCLIDAQPTKSLMLHIQKLGRVLRVSECGSKAIILDHASNIERLGFPTDELPQYLCSGDKDEIEKKKKAEKEKPEKLPTPCEQCNHLSIEFKCPVCGHTPAVIPGVEYKSGELKKLEKFDKSEKEKWLGMLLGYSREKGYSDGWSAHKYREKFGVWPAKKVGIHAVKPDQEVLNYIKYLNIKSAKSKKVEGFHEAPQAGYDYSVQTRSDGVKQVRVEKNGKWVGFAKQTPEIKQHVGLGG